jgi:alcohol dehydrogenase
VVFGAGELSRLPGLIEETASPDARVLLVTGSRSLRARGILPRVVEAIGPGRLALFDRVPPFPSPADADEAVGAARAARPDVVVGIGGGSALDVAKLAALLLAHDGGAREFATRQRALERPGLPVIAVPTTSGSSSEVTPFVALWDVAARRSMHLASPLLFPRIALVDPALALGMPPALAAVTGMDAFTSAFESYWSRDAGALTDALNLEVIRLFAAHLERSVLEADPEARAACALAATVSGMAYTNSRPNVCHAVGSPLTLRWGTAHGQAVGVTLPAFLAWNAPAIAPKLPALWRALGVGGLAEATTRITGLMARCGLATRLGALGLGPGDVETLVDEMRWERVAVLPRPLGRDDARAVLAALA